MKSPKNILLALSLVANVLLGIYAYHHQGITEHLRQEKEELEITAQKQQQMAEEARAQAEQSMKEAMKQRALAEAAMIKALEEKENK